MDSNAAVYGVTWFGCGTQNNIISWGDTYDFADYGCN